MICIHDLNSVPCMWILCLLKILVVCFNFCLFILCILSNSLNNFFFKDLALPGLIILSVHYFIRDHFVVNDFLDVSISDFLVVNISAYFILFLLFNGLAFPVLFI